MAKCVLIYFVGVVSLQIGIAILTGVYTVSDFRIKTVFEIVYVKVERKK